MWVWKEPGCEAPGDLRPGLGQGGEPRALLSNWGAQAATGQRERRPSGPTTLGLLQVVGPRRGFWGQVSPSWGSGCVRIPGHAREGGAARSGLGPGGGRLRGCGLVRVSSPYAAGTLPLFPLIYIHSAALSERCPVSSTGCQIRVFLFLSFFFLFFPRLHPMNDANGSGFGGFCQAGPGVHGQRGSIFNLICHMEILLLPPIKLASVD